jgi:hypothetical protein
MNRPNFDDVMPIDKLDKLASDIIDSSWHYSWHWDRDYYLTYKGVCQAIKDGKGLLIHYSKRLESVNKVLLELQKYKEMWDYFETEQI